MTMNSSYYMYAKTDYVYGPCTPQRLVMGAG